MESRVREISEVEVELQVDIPWERVQKDLNVQYRKLGQQARVKGFRPGKVPPKVVRQLFGKQVRGEVAAGLVEEGLMSAVQEHELQIVSQPEIGEAPRVEEGQPLSFTAKVEIRPKLEEVDTSALEIVRPAREVTDAEVDQEIERLREEHAELRVPEPMRPAREGDQLTIDYTVAIDGEDEPDMGATDRPVELGADRLIPEFEEGLVGLSPGEDAEITVEFADDHGNTDLQGKTATFQVHVKELREKRLPEVDDEFAKDVGDYETLLELRLDRRQQLEKMAERRAESELKEKIVDKLVETNPIPVPPSMIRQQEAQMAYEFAAFMQMSGAEPPPMSEELHDQIHERAERKVRAALLLGAVARAQGIDVGDGEVNDRLQEIAQQTGKHVAKVKADYQGERREQLENEILEEKLMDYLRGQARIIDAPPGDGSESPEPDQAKGSEEDASDEEGAPGKKTSEKKAAPKKKAATKKAAAKKKEQEMSEGEQDEASE